MSSTPNPRRRHGRFSAAWLPPLTRKAQRSFSSSECPMRIPCRRLPGRYRVFPAAVKPFCFWTTFSYGSCTVPVNFWNTCPATAEKSCISLWRPTPIPRRSGAVWYGAASCISCRRRRLPFPGRIRTPITGRPGFHSRASSLKKSCAWRTAGSWPCIYRWMPLSERENLNREAWRPLCRKHSGAVFPGTKKTFC